MKSKEEETEIKNKFQKQLLGTKSISQSAIINWFLASGTAGVLHVKLNKATIKRKGIDEKEYMCVHPL